MASFKMRVTGVDRALDVENSLPRLVSKKLGGEMLNAKPGPGYVDFDVSMGEKAVPDVYQKSLAPGGMISLGIKQLEDDPFSNYVAVNDKGAILRG